MSFLTGFEQIVRQNEPLAMHTWFQLGGPAEYFAEPENPDQLIELIRRCHREGKARGCWAEARTYWCATKA